MPRPGPPEAIWCGCSKAEAEGGTLLTVGSLGADFVRSFRRLTISYERMFLRGE